MAKEIWEKLTPIEKRAIAQGADLLSELREKVAPLWQERSGGDAQNLTAGRGLRELREAKQVSQEELASRLQRTQSAISQIEKRGDLLLSTCSEYVKALDGELMHLTVRFPEGEVQVVPFTAKTDDRENRAT